MTDDFKFPEMDDDEDAPLMASDMTMRDVFAGLAMLGMIARDTSSNRWEMVHHAYQIADAMMEAREE
jgi:hypothetical protein